jgi:pilus assembly protein CpaB
VTPRTLLVALLALSFGGSAAVGVNMIYSQRHNAPSDGIAVLVASRDIPRGMVLTPEGLSTREFPKNALPSGSILHQEEAIDRVALHSIVKDEPLLDQMLSQKHAKGGLAALVPKGMRAFTIQTPHVASHVAGFILPGNKVDVLLTMNSSGSPGDPTGGASTTTLLQNVEILAVDQRLEAPSENKVDPRNLQSVTLLVTPDQAAKLELGQNKGTLHLTLRNPGDTTAAKTRPATLSGLQFYQEPPWGEQVKNIISALTKLKEPAPRPAAGAPAQADGSPTVLEIRTVRGIYSGAVAVEPVQTHAKER